jgi:soluble lytic murein transglycosylase
VLNCSAWNPADPAAGRIFVHGIDRLTSEAPALAQAAWDLQRSRFAISSEDAARIDRRLGLALAAQRHGLTSAYLLELPPENADAQLRGWRVRAALGGQDWAAVLAALNRLEPQEKDKAQWRYWQARSLEALGGQDEALGAYRRAAQERDFYGFSAADRVGAEYPLAARIAPVNPGEIDRLAARPPFQAVSELLALNREGEARNEWMYAIKQLAVPERVQAAKLAERWHLDNLAINTAAEADYWDDLPLRFPLGYADAVTQAAQAQQLDPTLVYAIVRRESAFYPGASSSAGALGLMQLMPATGELMARRLNEAFPSANVLLEAGRNLRYGSTYLHGLMEKFGQQFALAAAAYNAGPGRVDRWLPADKPMPGDLWVETIPFSETRQYVAAVLSYAVIYQSRLNQAPRRIADLLPPVPTGSKAERRDDGPVSVPFCE